MEYDLLAWAGLARQITIPGMKRNIPLHQNPTRPIFQTIRQLHQLKHMQLYLTSLLQYNKLLVQDPNLHIILNIKNENQTQQTYRKEIKI